jgi:hypothetical protein
MRTIVLVLRSGGDFHFTSDVLLLVNQIHNKWKGPIKPRIILLWDKASHEYSLGNIYIIPLRNEFPRTWSRIQIYSPEMEQYRPFLYVDLDTAIITSIEKVFERIENRTDFIPIEDLWQKKELATGLAWIPAESEEVENVWKVFHSNKPSIGFRMDPFIRSVIKPKSFLQEFVNIADFKPKAGEWLNVVPDETDIVCFHGKPRIFDATRIKWVNEYVNYEPNWKGTKK